MNIILLENIYKLGKIGDQVKVKNGYGRNYLLRKGKALVANKENVALTNKNKDIKIIGINFKDKKNNAINFLEELGNPYSFVGEDIDGKISILFGVYWIHESILVDSDLTVIKKIIGPIDQIQYEEILKLAQWKQKIFFLSFIF